MVRPFVLNANGFGPVERRCVKKAGRENGLMDDVYDDDWDVVVTFEDAGYGMRV